MRKRSPGKACFCETIMLRILVWRAVEVLLRHELSLPRCMLTRQVLYTVSAMLLALSCTGSLKAGAACAGCGGAAAQPRARARKRAG